MNKPKVPRVSTAKVDIVNPATKMGAETAVVKRHEFYNQNCPQCSENKDIITFGLLCNDPQDQEPFAWCPCGFRWVVHHESPVERQ